MGEKIYLRSQFERFERCHPLEIVRDTGIECPNEEDNKQ